MRIFVYCIKVWIISIFIGALLFYLLNNPTDDSSMTFLGYMVVVCLYAMLYSCISFFLFWACVALLTNGEFSVRRQKWIATAAGTILTIVPFAVLFGRNHPNWLGLAKICSCYLIPLLAAIWVFRIPQVVVE